MTRVDRLLARATRMAPFAAAGSVGAMTLAALVTMFGRIAFRHDLEWMTGSILDHIERIQRGLPLYTPPTVRWIPFLYPPLYYWVCAWCSRVADVRVVARLVSIASTLLQAYFIARSARRLGASRLWSFVAAGMLFTAYPLVEFWFDIERPDSLFVAMVLGGYVLLAESAGVAGALLAGVVLGAAFFAKQPALLFLGAGALALLLRREWARALAFVTAAALAIVPLALHLDTTSEGWFGYYVLQMPRAHGISLGLLPSLLTDLSHAWVYTLATLAAAYSLLDRRTSSRQFFVFLAFLAASFVASASSRMHVGGWPNVLMFWVAFASIAVGVVGSRLTAVDASSEAPRTGNAARAVAWLPAIVSAAIVLQVVQLLYSPATQIPTAVGRDLEDHFTEHVHELERSGDVLVMGRGHTSTQRHFHDAAFYDVLYVEKRVPEAILESIRHQELAAILINNFDDLWLPYEPAVGDTFFRVVAAHYFIAERVDERLPNSVLGFQVHPMWVLERRTQPLPEDGPMEPLLRQHLAEISIAQARQEAERRGVVFGAHTPGADVLGAELVARLYQDAQK